MQPRDTASPQTLLLNPRLEPVLRLFKHVLVAELNMGQLILVLRARFLIDAIGLNKIQGLPFKVREVVTAVENLLGTKTALAEGLRAHLRSNDQQRHALACVIGG